MNFDGSKVLCQICSQSIREALCLFELTDEESIQFNEKDSIRCFRELSQEQKLEFLSKLLKNNQSIEGLFLPYSIDIFNDSVRPMFSLMS